MPLERYVFQGGAFVYMLNMLFDPGAEHGKFDDGLGATALQRSKRWLRHHGNSPDQPPRPPFNPHDSGNWDDLGKFNVVIPKIPGGGPSGHRIFIRIAPMGGMTTLANPVIDFAVAFGRPAVGGGDKASPFRLTPGATTGGAVGNRVRTTYVKQDVGPDDSSAGGGWLIDLGRVVEEASPGEHDVTNRYEFALGVIVKQRNAANAVIDERHYGEDPEDDVGG